MVYYILENYIYLELLYLVIEQDNFKQKSIPCIHFKTMGFYILIINIIV